MSLIHTNFNSILSSRWAFLLLLSIFGFNGIPQGNSQIFLQLEFYDNPKSIKYQVGEQLTFKTEESSQWITKRIEKLDYDNQIIIFTSSYQDLTEITQVKRHKKWVKQLGLKLMQFSAAWFLYGGIAHFAADDFDFGYDTLGIGGGALLTGYVMYKFAGTSTYDVKNKERLRIIDVSWPDPVRSRSLRN